MLQHRVLAKGGDDVGRLGHEPPLRLAPGPHTITVRATTHGAGDERAIVADPEYALPHSGIADVYAVMGNRDLMPPREAFPVELVWVE